MSVLRLPDAHINLIASATVVLGMSDEAGATALGVLLREANDKSFNERYGESRTSPDYRYEFIPLESIWGLRIAVESYLYQTSELPDYDKNAVITTVKTLYAKVNAIGTYPSTDWEQELFWHYYTGVAE